METTIKFNPELGNIAMSAFIIEKIHRCADCPIRQHGDQTTRSRSSLESTCGTRPGGRAGKPIKRRTCAFAARAGTHA